MSLHLNQPRMKYTAVLQSWVSVFIDLNRVRAVLPSLLSSQLTVRGISRYNRMQQKSEPTTSCLIVPLPT